MTLLVAVLLSAFAVSSASASSAATGYFEVDHGFVKAPECVKVGERVPLNIRVKNDGSRPVKVTISPIGLSDSPWSPYAIAGAKPSLRGESLNAGSTEYPIIVHAVYWSTLLQPGQEKTFQITLLIRDYKKFPQPEGYPALSTPWPPDFMYAIRVGSNLAKSQMSATTTPYCGVPLPPGYGDWYGGGKGGK